MALSPPHLAASLNPPSLGGLGRGMVSQFPFFSCAYRYATARWMAVSTSAELAAPRAAGALANAAITATADAKAILIRENVNPGCRDIREPQSCSALV